MGGATDASSNDWSECAEKVRGKIYNVYSDNDRALRYLKLDFELPIGITPIPERHKKIKNIKCDLSHKLGYDYMHNLRWLFDRKIMPNRKLSKKYLGHLVLECPWEECKHKFLKTPYIDSPCPECGVIFQYNLREQNIEFSKEHPEPISVECPECGRLLPIQESAAYQCPYCYSWTECKRKGNKVEYYADCDDCGGDGMVECDQCDGEGEVECDVCEGYGYFECGYCKREGCGHCNDQGIVPCKKCDAEKSVTCSECDGTGNVECEECNGEGKIWYVT